MTGLVSWWAAWADGTFDTEWAERYLRAVGAVPGVRQCRMGVAKSGAMSDPFHPVLDNETLLALGRAVWATIRFANLAERVCVAAAPAKKGLELGRLLETTGTALADAQGTRASVVTWLPGAQELWARRNDLVHGASTITFDPINGTSGSPYLRRARSGGTVAPTAQEFNRLAADAQALIDEAVRLDVLLAARR